MRDTLDNRPTCSVPGCDRPAAEQYGSKHPRYPRWRRESWILEDYPEVTGEPFCCSKHHDYNNARRHGVKNVGRLTRQRKAEAKKRGFNTIAEMWTHDREQQAVSHGFTLEEFRNGDAHQQTAMLAGYARAADYKNLSHPYRYVLHQIKFCQNSDGRCGVQCPVDDPEKFSPGMLTVDHIDGNHDNNDRVNLQVICACCHGPKSSKFKDILPWDKKPEDINAMVAELQEKNRQQLVELGIPLDGNPYLKKLEESC